MKNLFSAALAMALGVAPVFAQQSLDGDFRVVRDLKMEKTVLEDAHLFVNDSKYEVVEVRKLPNGCSIEVRKNAEGGLYKVLVNPNVQNLEIEPRYRMYANGDAFISEDFEGWDGVTTGWIPEGWDRKPSTDDYLTREEGRFTWHVGKQINSLPRAVNGENYALIYYAHYVDENNKTIDMPQDEWLYTPVFDVKSNEDLFCCYLGYSPLFLFDVSNENLDFNKHDFVERKPSANLHVLIREENGTEWKELMNLYDEWKETPFDDLFSLLNNRFSPYDLSLNGYKGKRVQIAFRYEGIQGNTMEIDAINVVHGGRAKADYTTPQGTFRWGFAADFMSVVDNTDKRSLLLMPAYNSLTWMNQSEDADEFEWTYADPNYPNQLDKRIVSTDVDLKVTYPYGLFSIPTLKASAPEMQSGEYQMPALGMQAGGQSYYSDGKGGIKLYGVGNYDLHNLYTSVQSFDGSYLFGYSEGTQKAWSSMYGKDVKLEGIANVFGKPMIPYYLSEVMVHGVGDITKDAKFKLTVYRMDGNNMTNEVLGVATCSGSDIVQVDNHENLYVTLPFHLENLIIDDSIVMVLTGFNDGGIIDFGVLHGKLPAKDNENNGYYLMQMDGKTSMFPISELVMGSDHLYSSFYFGTNAAYSWVLSDSNKMIVDKEGGEQTFQISTYFDNQSWEITPTYQKGQDTEWVHITTTATTMDVKVDAWKGAGKERTCDITLKSAGAEAVFHIIQNETGTSIENALEDKSFVYVDGNSFVVESEQPSVEIYNAFGVKMANVKLDNEHTVVPASEWPSGAYLFRFADGTVVKMLK